MHGDDEAVERVIVVSLALVMLVAIGWQCVSFWVTTARVGGRIVREEGPESPIGTETKTEHED